MNNRKKRIVITSGTGSGKKRTLPALQTSTVAEVVAMHGRNKNKLDQLSDQNSSLPVYSDLEEMLDASNFDIVYVASPPFLHRYEIDLAARKSVPIICEKPLANNLNDAMEIARIIQERHIPFMLAHHLRHQPAIVQVERLLNSNLLGEVRFALIQWNFEINVNADNAQWKLNPSLGGKHSFFDAGIHAIDLAIYYWGIPISVFATGTKLLATESFDTVTAILQYKNFNVVLNSSQKQTTIGNDFYVYCEKGVIQLPQALAETSSCILHVLNESGEKQYTFDKENLYKNEVETFVKSLNSQPSEYRGTSIDEALIGMRILEAISISLDTRSTINISSI